MSEHTEKAFAMLSRFCASTERRSQSALVLRDRTLGMPTVPIHPFVEPPFHLLPVLALGPRATAAPRVQRNHRGANPQFLAAQPMVVLAVVGGIGQQPVEVDVARSLTHGLWELRRVVARPPARHGPREQVRVGFTHDRELRPMPSRVRLGARSTHIVGTGVPALQAGGIDGPLGVFPDQAGGSGPVEHCVQEALESPFFRRRFSA